MNNALDRGDKVVWGLRRIVKVGEFSEAREVASYDGFACREAFEELHRKRGTRVGVRSMRENAYVGCGDDPRQLRRGHSWPKVYVREPRETSRIRSWFTFAEQSVEPYTPPGALPSDRFD